VLQSLLFSDIKTFCQSAWIISLSLDIQTFYLQAIQAFFSAATLAVRLIGRPSHGILDTMSNIISRRAIKGQTPHHRPPLPVHCIHLNPAFSLCSFPRTQQAQKTWQMILRTIRADLEVQAKYNSPNIVSAAMGLG
jgi:hypothetical protein